MFPQKISQNIDTLASIHGNVFPWQLTFMGNKTSFYAKHQSLMHICLSVMNSPVFPSLDDIFCETELGNVFIQTNAISKQRKMAIPDRYQKKVLSKGFQMTLDFT